jgi:acyl carrier protein
LPHSKTEIKNIIRRYVLENYLADEPDVLTDETGLLSEDYIDSISVMVLVEFLETSFEFEFEPHEVDEDNLDTIDRMVAFVESKQA